MNLRRWDYASLAFNVAICSASQADRLLLTVHMGSFHCRKAMQRQESARRVWDFEHDEKHLELCHGVDRVRDVCRKDD